MTLDSIISQAAESAANLLEIQGEIAPMVFIHSRGRIAGLPYGGSDLERKAIVDTIKMCRRTDNFDHAILLSEAWMAKMPKGFKEGDPIAPGHASRDPQREEVVIAHVLLDTGDSGSAIWPLIRTAVGKPLLGEKKKLKKETTHSWLDEALAGMGGRDK